MRFKFKILSFFCNNCPKIIILPPKCTEIILDYYVEIDYYTCHLKQGLEGKLIRMLKNGNWSPDQYLASAPLPGFFRVNVMYERPLSNSCEILGFFVKSGHVPKAQSMHKWVTFLPNSFCLSGDNAVLQFLRLFDPRDLGAINQDSPVIIVRISINFLK